MSKQIPLTKGFFATVDDCDYERITGFRWYALETHSRNVYAVRSVYSHSVDGKRKTGKIYMHREILLGAKMIDHKDGNGLNNSRSNLRECTHSQNYVNSRVAPGFRGVCFRPDRNKWEATIKHNKKRFHLGTFETEAAARAAYIDAAVRFHGEFLRVARVD